MTQNKLAVHCIIHVDSSGISSGSGLVIIVVRGILTVGFVDGPCRLGSD